jgi:hypothetical protein
MGNPTHDLILGIREAAFIWLALVGLAVTAFVVVSVTARRSSRRADARRSVRRSRRAVLADQADELRRYADEITVVADRATVTANRRHDEWVAAQRRQEAAWRAYDAAETAARRAMAATAFPSRYIVIDPSELADREEFLHRAATAAHQRGELSDEQLADVLTHRNGWSPYLSQADQETTLCRIAAYRLHHAYRVATRVEQDAWHAAEMAVAAKRSLDAEAAVAVLRARQAAERLRAASQTRREHPAVRRLPTLAIR